MFLSTSKSMAYLLNPRREVEYRLFYPVEIGCGGKPGPYVDARPMRSEDRLSSWSLAM
jgi:hypothetical protein